MAVIYDPVGMPEGWPDVKAVVSVVRQREVGGVSTTTTNYYISSHAGTASEMAGLIRGHWGIENGLHWVLDVVFHEDQSRIREGHAGENLGLLRRVAVALLKVRPRERHHADQAPQGRLGRRILAPSSSRDLKSGRAVALGLTHVHRSRPSTPCHCLVGLLRSTRRRHSRNALQRGVCRQRLYREAHSVLARPRSPPLAQQIAHLPTTGRPPASPSRRTAGPPTATPLSALLTCWPSSSVPPRPKASACRSPAASPPSCCVMTSPPSPVGTFQPSSRPARGRCRKSLTSITRPRVHQAAADEIFFGQKPVLMVVEPQSHCWL